MSKDEKQVGELRKPERPLQKAGFMFIPQTWEQLYNYAKEIALTDFVPDQMKGKPGAVLAAWQKGSEVGLGPMASLENIAIINGHPSIHSSGYWGLITSHALCEDWSELGPGEALAAGYGECTIKRRGKKDPVTRRFTIDMAKTAKLWGNEKKENWVKYPGRSLQWRARHLAGDDAIPEATQGLLPSDVAQDLEPRDVTPAPEPLRMPEPIKEEKDENGSSDTPPLAESGPQSTESEEIIDWIMALTDPDYFVDTQMLTEHLKGQSNKDQMAICRAWNERKKQLAG